MQLIKIGEPINIEIENKEKEVRPTIIKHNKQFYFIFIYDLSCKDSSKCRRLVMESKYLKHDTRYHTFFSMDEHIHTKICDSMKYCQIINAEASYRLSGILLPCTLKKAKQLYLKTYILYSKGGHNEDT